MAKQMFFGNEQHFQWVPAPATGMEAANVGFGDELEYQNGRKGIVRSMQTHKEFGIEFPVQEASGLTGLDVFTKYSSGFYGDLDSYPLFFADPMNYDQNLFPPGWASPGLFSRGWASVVSTDAKTFYNLALNPSVEVNAAGYIAVPGTSGTNSGARLLTTSVSGQYSYRATWTVATSVVSGGVTYEDTPAAPGTSYDYSWYVTTSKIQRVLVTVRYRNSGGTSLGTSLGTQTVLAANTTTKLTVTASVAPANTATVDVEVAAVSGTSGANWANGDWLQVDALMISPSPNTSPTYFDGSTPGAGWAGAIHASSSVMHISRTVPVISDTAANIYNLPPIQATWDVVSTVNAYPTVSNTFGEIPYALIPIPPGYMLWMGVTGSVTGTAGVRVDAFNAPGNPAAPVASTTLTLLSPAGATRLNTSFSSVNYQYVKVYIRRTSTVASTITLSSMVAQLWPIGVTPNVDGNFIEGKGHRGLKFADSATIESYVLVDRNRNIPVHYKGLSTRLVEAQDKG